MCGIAGFISTRFNESHLRQSTDCLVHRGPDASGVFYDEAHHTGLGHRRLSIIDLSESANQPMYSADGRYVMVFNGEIYNFLQLRGRLPAHAWRTHGDSEVVLELFAAFGAESFAWLNGMYAVAIYDLQERRLTIARDPVGIKPVYYHIGQEHFIFASELKSIRSLLPDLRVNAESIPYFLHLAYIPAPLTIYEGVHKFPAGKYATVQLSGRTPVLSAFKSFWQIEDHIGREVIRDEASAREGLRQVLFEAVERQLVSDVPSGTFLSGGIDSSVVTAVASKVAAGKIKTFSIAVVDGKVNEAPYAAAVARHLGTEHYELPIRQQQVLDMVPDLLGVYDEPFGDTSAFPTMLVSKLAREHVTMALSGDGGDEQFMGYGTYLWAQRLSHPALRALRHPLYAASTLAPDYYRHAGRMLNYPDHAQQKSHIFAQDMFSAAELRRLLRRPSFSFTALNAPLDTARALSPREAQSFWDMKYYLPDDLLVKVDRASMKYSLETRVPLLDLEVLRYSLNVHESLKVKNGQMKHLLKSVLYELVPASYFDRPKSGFSIPLAKLLREDLRPLVEKYFTRETIERFGYLHAAEALQIRQQFYKGKTGLFYQVWLITLLHWWLSEHE